ncbi:MAG: YceI family protein [Myxococcota bacterium]
MTSTHTRLALVSALALAAACPNTCNNGTPDAGPIPQGGGSGVIKIDGEAKNYRVATDRTRLLILSRRASGAGCSIFHHHAVASLSTLFEFTLDKDAPGTSTLTARVPAVGLDPDKPEYRQVFEATRQADAEGETPSESDRDDIKVSVLEQVDADRHPILTFQAHDLSTLDGSGTSRVDVTIRGISQTIDFPATASWSGDVLTITGNAPLSGSPHGMPVGSLKDCIDPNMQLDMVLVLEPGEAPPVEEPDAGPPYVQQLFPDDGSCGTVNYASVRAILDKHCVGCHREPPARGASVPLMDLTRHLRADTRRNQGEPLFHDVARRVQDGNSAAMPPPLDGDPLTQAEIDTIVLWANEGGHGCGYDGGMPARTPITPRTCGDEAVAWTNDVENIFKLPISNPDQEAEGRAPTACTDCHFGAGDDGALPPLDTYAAGLELAQHPYYQPLTLWEASLLRMEDMTMPPGVDFEGHLYVDVTQDDIDRVREWIRQGMPENPIPDLQPCDQPDAGPPGDAGPPSDAGPVTDAGPVDAGPPGPIESVRVLAPNGGETLSGQITVTWETTGQGNTATVGLIFGGVNSPVNISAVDIPNTGSFTFDSTQPVNGSINIWDGTDYKVRVSVKGPNADGGIVTKRDDSNAPFTIDNGGRYGTTYRYDSAANAADNIKPLIDAYCADCGTQFTGCISCHNDPPTEGAPFQLTQYGRNDAGAGGVYFNRVRVKNSIESNFMPLQPDAPDMTAEDAQKVIDWANGGAPR